MPLLADRMLLQTVIAFVTIAVFALILRWTFGRDRQRTPPFPEPNQTSPPGEPNLRNSGRFPDNSNEAKPPDITSPENTVSRDKTTSRDSATSRDNRPPTDRPLDAQASDAPASAARPDSKPADRSHASTPPAHAMQSTARAAASDDFGLLATVARTETRAAAAQMRQQLGQAGIRATTAHGADGRFRVLVFSSDLHRARRVVRSGGNSGRA